MNFRNPALLALAAAGLLAAPRSVFAQHDMHHSAAAPATASAPAANASITVKGELLDIGCYLGHNIKGPGHAKCAQMCAAKGVPVGLLTEDGTLYLLTIDHWMLSYPGLFNAAKASAGTTVTITGEVNRRNGMLALTVKKIEA